MTSRPHNSIGVRMLIAAGDLPDSAAAKVAAIADFFAPKNNHIATMMMNNLLKAELALDGLEATSQLFGPFNQLKGIVYVDDLDRALVVVERVFADLGFTPLSFEISWWNRAEGRWQLHTEGDSFEFNRAFDEDVLRAEINHWREKISKASPK